MSILRLFPEDEGVVRMFGRKKKDLKGSMGFSRDLGHKVPKLAAEVRFSL